MGDSGSPTLSTAPSVLVQEQDPPGCGQLTDLWHLFINHWAEDPLTLFWLVTIVVLAEILFRVVLRPSGCQCPGRVHQYGQTTAGHVALQPGAQAREPTPGRTPAYSIQPIMQIQGHLEVLDRKLEELNLRLERLAKAQDLILVNVSLSGRGAPNVTPNVSYLVTQAGGKLHTSADCPRARAKAGDEQQFWQIELTPDSRDWLLKRQKVVFCADCGHDAAVDDDAAAAASDTV